jgi:transposase InsO family protein
MSSSKTQTNTWYQQCAESYKSREVPITMKPKNADPEDDVTSTILEIFHKNRKAYGTRKIKVELHKRGFIVSRRRIGHIMKEQGLISCYTKAKFKAQKTTSNESKQANELNRQFQQEEAKKVVISDLTYVRVKNKWHFICILLDLYNREIIGFSTGSQKNKELVARAFASVQGDLRQIQMFHTDRGNEFKNQLIEQTLETFHISQSLSMKGCPYDNAVAEATFKIIKTEFVHQMTFNSLEQLTIEFRDYVNWFNKFRIHGILGYVSPEEYKQSHLKEVV